MSEKDKIREMVMALARGDHAEANKAATAVMAAKTKRIAEAAINDSEEDSDEGEKVTEGDRYMRAGRRHNRAGRRDVRRNARSSNDMHRREGTYEGGSGNYYEGGRYYGEGGHMYERGEDGHYYNEAGHKYAGDMPAYEARRPRDMDDDEYRMRKHRKADPSMRRRRPRRSQMHETTDTGSDSGVVKGKHDDDSEDNTERKGSVKDSGVVKGKHDDGDSGAK